MLLRDYEPGRDQEAVKRIWQEAGWLKPEPRQEEAFGYFVQAGRAHVAEVGGSAECFVLTNAGTIQYQTQELPLCNVAAVTTSRVARRMGLARRLTARAVAVGAAEGAAVSTLGAFDQGFYNQLGFGTGNYLHWLVFDPANIRVPAEARPPQRIGLEHWEAVHASRLARRRCHGAVSIFSPLFTRSGMVRLATSFGLGYFDGPPGELTHHIWMSAEAPRGPYHVLWMSYRTPAQFLELMALLHGLSDQVRVVRMVEPAGIQMQDILARPFRMFRLQHESGQTYGIYAAGFWQARICDLFACLERTSFPAGPVRFNLKLRDPIAQYLDEDAPWRGIAGEYVVTLGQESGAEAGHDPALPMLEATAGSFTRLWLGVLPASSLAFTDHLRGPAELLEQLDAAIRLPPPHVDWDL
ncbi:MAG: GNAT family N-acetyltransferase [Anaerolineae bacterium]